jgi:hypothetical protein
MSGLHRRGWMGAQDIRTWERRGKKHSSCSKADSQLAHSVVTQFEVDKGVRGDCHKQSLYARNSAKCVSRATPCRCLHSSQNGFSLFLMQTLSYTPKPSLLGALSVQETPLVCSSLAQQCQTTQRPAQMTPRLSAQLSS